MSRLIRLGDVLFFMLFYRLNTVICQVKVQAYVGDEVVLPCVYNEASPLPDAASVFWRDKDNYVVLNIKQGRPDYSSQNKKFKGRVFSEQDGNMKGNFSIVMKSVQEADHGTYECHVPKVSFQRGVSL
ncbi:V-set domain-containing T-cell activation inhibitor 1-like, partial [Sander vitreus]